MHNFKARIHTIAVAVLLAMTFSCQSARPLPDFEAMPQAESDSITADISDIARITASGLLRHDKVKAEDVLVVATVLDFAASDEAATGGPNLIVGVLKAAGVDNADVLDGMALVDIALRHYVNLGALGLPLGPHARQALGSVAVALRDAVVTSFPPIARP